MALLDLNEKATTRLGLEPIKNPQGGWLFNGCVPATVVSFTKTTQKHEKGEFAGMEVPVLAIEFTNLKLSPSDPDRFLTHYIKPIGSKKLVEGTSDQYTDREEKEIQADNVETWKQLKHFLESLTGSPNFRNITSIPKEDYPIYFDLPGHGDAKSRAATYDKFFGYIEKFVNGDGKDKKSMLLNANNEPLNLWIKLAPNYSKDPKRNAKYYEIPRFIGSGVFETLKVGENKIPISPKIIKVKTSESLELLATPTAKAGQGTAMPKTAAASHEDIPDDIRDIMSGR